jgi:hypothetical protein
VTRRLSVLAIAALVTLSLAAPLAHAIPALQLYSPDAVYDIASESWLIADDTFELWVIGAVGDYGTIYDVTLAASYYGSAGTVTPMGGLPIDTDYATKPGFTNGVQNHEEFKNADGHIFWDIGDFTGTSDQIQDYAGVAGGDPLATDKFGEIKKYMFHVTGYDAVHFDAFDHYYTGTVGSANYKLHGVFAPFSHDATGGGGNGGGGTGGGGTGGGGSGGGGGGGGGGSVPEPGVFLMLGGGFLGILATRKRNA